MRMQSYAPFDRSRRRTHLLAAMSSPRGDGLWMGLWSEVGEFLESTGVLDKADVRLSPQRTVVLVFGSCLQAFHLPSPS